MKIYIKIILFLLMFNTSVKTWAALPPAVKEAMKDVVSISWLKNDEIVITGSGFIVKDNNKFVLVTAYHVIKEVMNQLDDIEVTSQDEEQLKIKKIISYSKGSDVVFLELESYKGAGLKFSPHPSYKEGGVFLAGRKFSSPLEEENVETGEAFTHPSKRIFNILFEKADVGALLGFSGGPLLNVNGEVIGIFSQSNLIYEYGAGFKSDVAKDLLRSPKGKTSAVNLIPSWLHRTHTFNINNTFLHKPNLRRVQALADNDFGNSQTLLQTLDRMQLINLGAGAMFINLFVIGSVVFTYAEGWGAVATLTLNSVVSGSMFLNLCSKSFAHFKNRAVLALGGKEN